MSNIKPTKDEMPILTLADRRGTEPGTKTVPALSKFGGLDGAHLCVEALRGQADKITLWLERGWDLNSRHPLKPMRRKILDAQLTATCTCIELLTVNGNYYRERTEAEARVRGE